MTATVVVVRDDAPLGAGFVEPLVARLHAEYGITTGHLPNRMHRL